MKTHYDFKYLTRSWGGFGFGAWIIETATGSKLLSVAIGPVTFYWRSKPVPPDLARRDEQAGATVTFVAEYEGDAPEISAKTDILGGKLLAVSFDNAIQRNEEMEHIMNLMLGYTRRKGRYIY